MSPEWIDVGASAGLSEGGLLKAEVSGRELVLVRRDGVAYALDGRCPHRGGELWKGDLVGHRLACPLHAWCYDVRDGVAFFPKGARLAAHAVREEGGRLQVQLAAPDLGGFTPPNFDSGGT